MLRSNRLAVRARGFTLLEVLAVVLLLGVVFFVMASVFSQIAKTAADPELTERTRRGLLLVDRVSRDLEGAVLMEKPDDIDPLAHPWLFYADSRGGSGGANRIKFDSRAARSAAEHAGDVAVVAYWTEIGDDGGLELLRWTSPALPESLDRSFPSRNDEGAAVIARGLARFALRFTDEDGVQTESWDSSTLERSGRLPVSVEIEVALADETADEGEVPFRKLAVLAIRPIDLAAALSPDGESDDEDDEDEEDDDCVTVGQCVARNAAAYSAFLATQADPAAIRAAVDAASDQCWEDVQPSLGIQLANCE
jgi:prepilin-type N-terminal cleavage/methylation domain-containing protein